jgi:hypothetical protein
VDILAPSFGNGCENHYRRSTARSTVATHPGSVAGNGVGVPVTGPFNQCGGADPPVGRHVCVIHQWFPGTNVLSEHVLNDAEDVPIEAIVQVFTLLTEAQFDSHKPIVNGNCR